ncbi:MAG: oligosaccharide flippase family protein [Clostridia bacterium]|nr:oligosaccharide flippase family protein [Clostridia bacterium]
MEKLYKTAFIITLFSLAEKFLGFLYRIFLSRTIGSEGVGLYQITLSVFAALLTISSSGIPVTVSRLITKYRSLGQRKKESSVITAGFFITLIIAVPITLIIFAFPNLLSLAFADERCITLFTVLLPALTINAVYSVLRGVFWGTQDFLPYAAIELIEETVMIVVGVILVSLSTSVYIGTEKAIIAVVISYAVSFILGTLLFIYRGGKIKNPRHQLKPLILSSLPITAMRTAGSLVGSLVSILLPLRLIDSGMGKVEATSAFGAFYGMAMPLLFIPMSLIGPFSVVLVPKITESFYKNDNKSLNEDINRALNLTAFLSCMLVPAFTCFGEEFGVFLFDSFEGGKYISHSAFLMILMSSSSISTSILNSLGEENKTFLSFVLSNGFLVLSILILPKYIGIYALLVGYLAVYLVNLIINLQVVKKRTKIKLNFYKFFTFSILFLIPTIILGFLLKNLLLVYLGSFLSSFLISIIITIVYILLHQTFDLINLKCLINKKFFSKLFIKKQKRRIA